jgi:hypothetical protein
MTVITVTVISFTPVIMTNRKIIVVRVSSHVIKKNSESPL